MHTPNSVIFVNPEPEFFRPMLCPRSTFVDSDTFIVREAQQNDIAFFPRADDILKFVIVHSVSFYKWAE
jgi:hypothetical protein